MIFVIPLYMHNVDIAALKCKTLHIIYNNAFLEEYILVQFYFHNYIFMIICGNTPHTHPYTTPPKPHTLQLFESW